MTGRPPGLRKQATSAHNRRALLAPEIEAAAGRPFRTRLWVLLRWLMAEAMDAPALEQEQLLTDLLATVEAMNARRQKGRKPR